MNSKELTQHSINYVRNQIKAKNSNLPYFATANLVKNSVTDMDTFPYNRHFRGVYYENEPIVMEREAGWRKRHDRCYQPTYSYTPSYPKHCFQAGCSTVYPCYPEYLRKYSDKDEMDIMLNKLCINRSP